MRTVSALCVAVGIASTAFAAPKTAPTPAPIPPTYAGAYQPQGVDEIGLWREDDERERRLADSPIVIRDEALNAYVRNVLCVTVGVDRCKSVRVYIVRVPAFNATMSPNGMMLVYSGLLLRARSEAELGTVLGHEFAHFEKRHSLSQFKAARRGSDLLTWAAVLTSMSGSAQTHRIFESLEFSVLGNFARFGRDQEREADLLGLGYLNAGPMRPHAASRIFRNLILEAEASAAARGLRKPDVDRNSFFASHPANGERVDYLYALAAPEGETRQEGAENYVAALSPWMTIFLDDQIAINDFGASDFIIGKLAEGGWNADLWRARGDLYRGRGHPRDIMNAADFYTKAVALNPNLAEAQRGLGLSFIKTGRPTEGKRALQQYVQLKPNALDVAMINLTISSLGEPK